MTAFPESVFDAGASPPVFSTGWKAFFAEDVLVQISSNAGWQTLERDEFSLSELGADSAKVALPSPRPGRQLRVRRVSTPVQRAILNADDAQGVRDTPGIIGDSAINATAMHIPVERWL